MLSNNWSIIKLLYYIKTFYPGFDSNGNILEQCLYMSSEKEFVYMLYLKKLLDSIDGIDNIMFESEFREQVLCFRLGSAQGEQVFDKLSESIDDIRDELYCNCSLDADDFEGGPLEFCVSLYDETSPTALQIIRESLDESLFKGLEDYIYVNFYEADYVDIYIHLDVSSLFPDNIEQLQPLENYIKFLELNSQ